MPPTATLRTYPIARNLDRLSSALRASHPRTVTRLLVAGMVPSGVSIGPASGARRRVSPAQQGLGEDQVFSRWRELDAHDSVVLGDHPSEFRWREPARVQPLQVCVGRPTGDGAALSDVDRNPVVDELLQ